MGTPVPTLLTSSGPVAVDARRLSLSKLQAAAAALALAVGGATTALVVPHGGSSTGPVVCTDATGNEFIVELEYRVDSTGQVIRHQSLRVDAIAADSAPENRRTAHFCIQGGGIGTVSAQP